MGGALQTPAIILGVSLQLCQGGVAYCSKGLVIHLLGERKWGAHRPLVQAHAGCQVPIGREGKVGLVGGSDYCKGVHADVLCLRLHISSNAMVKVKCFRRGSLAKARVTRDKSDIAGEILPDELHEAGIPVVCAGRGEESGQGDVEAGLSWQARV